MLQKQAPLHIFIAEFFPQIMNRPKYPTEMKQKYPRKIRWALWAIIYGFLLLFISLLFPSILPPMP